MASVASLSPTPRVASVWHTGGLVLIMVALCGLGAYQQRRPGTDQNLVASHRGIVPLYLSLIVSEWALVLYVRAGTRRTGTRLRDLIGGRWRGPKDVLRDVAIAAVFWPVWAGVAWLVHLALGPNQAKSIAILLPRGPVEILLWILVSISAGICEELVFRGYLQKQLAQLSGSGMVAVAGQAVVFGIGHGYQGTKQVVVIIVLGALYGFLALGCRSLRPGMMAHAWSDIFGGILAGS